MEKMKKFKEWAPKVFGEKKTQKIVMLSEKRDSIIENYGEIYFKISEMNKNLSDIDGWLRERYGVGKYIDTDRPEEVKKELDKKVMARVCRIAGGKFWSDTRNEGAERWSADIRKTYSERNASESEIDELCWIIAMTKREALIECAIKISWYADKERKWKSNEERRKAFEFKDKQKLYCQDYAQARVAEIILGIAQQTGKMDRIEIEEMIEDMTVPRAGTTKEWKGIMKMKSFKESCDITILMPGLSAKINEYVKEGLDRLIGESQKATCA
jgi:hypothetical protein